jgi:exodeoxyribonuclease VII small subunit
MNEDKQPQSYEQAAQELEEILQDLQDGQIGIDQLAGKVQRAGELLKFCQNRLRQTEDQVNQIIADMDPDKED